MSAIIILIITTVVALYHIKIKNTAFFAFILFFQHIPLIIFDSLGDEKFGYIYYVILTILYIVRSKKIYYERSRVLNYITISIYLILLAFFLHYIIVGIDPANVRGYSTVHDFIILNVPLFIICIFFIPANEKSYKNILHGILIYGSILLFTLVFVAGLNSLDLPTRGDFRDEYRMSPLAAAKASGLIIMAALMFLYYEYKFKKKILYTTIFLMSTAMLIVTASRAAFLFLIIVLIIFFAIRRDNDKNKYLLLISLFFISIIGYYIIQYLNLPFIERLQRLENYESFLRYRRIQIALEMLTNFDLWITGGLGPFGFGHATGLSYPHNYILELLVDYGIIGAISLILLFGGGIYYSYKVAGQTYWIAWVVPFFIYNFLTKMTSGDIVGARHMLFVGILIANIIPKIRIKNKQKSNEQT